MSNLKKYIFSADLLRAVAILLVVIVHVCSGYLSTPVILGSSIWWFANILETAGKVAVGLWFWTYGAFEIARQAYTRFYCQQAPIEEFISDLEKGLSDPEGFPQDGILSLAIQNKTQSLFIFFSYTGKGKDRSPLLLSFWEQR
jgi:hypothetical protein